MKPRALLNAVCHHVHHENSVGALLAKVLSIDRVICDALLCISELVGKLIRLIYFLAAPTNRTLNVCTFRFMSVHLHFWNSTFS